MTMDGEQKGKKNVKQWHCGRQQRSDQRHLKYQDGKHFQCVSFSFFFNFFFFKFILTIFEHCCVKKIGSRSWQRRHPWCDGEKNTKRKWRRKMLGKWIFNNIRGSERSVSEKTLSPQVIMLPNLIRFQINFRTVRLAVKFSRAMTFLRQWGLCFVCAFLCFRSFAAP
jgi:hypothetical protein